MYCNRCGAVIGDAPRCTTCGEVVPAVAVQKKMLRPRNDRKIAGVCAALGRYFDLDITLIRVMAAVALIFTGGTVLVPYIIGWVVIPEEPEIVIAIPQRVG